MIDDPTTAVSVTEVVSFHPHLDIWGLLLGFVIAYEYGIRRLAVHHAPQGEPVVAPRQRWYFYGGIVLLGVATTWPIHDIGEQSLFTFHMIEHLTMTLVAPPLLLLGTPWWFLRTALGPVMSVFRVVTKPIVALVAFNAVVALVHVPGVIEAMLTSEVAHLVTHTALFVTAVLMWFPVIGTVPDLPRLSPFAAIGYLFLQSLVPTIPASFLTLAEGPVYAVYESLPRVWGWSVVADQTVAGLIMKLGGGAILWTAMAIIFFRWHAEEERAAASARVRIGPG